MSYDQYSKQGQDTNRNEDGGNKPRTNHFHVWGCDVYYYVVKSKRDTKMGARATPGIFVGYDQYNDAYYRVFNVDSEEVIRTRDLTLHDCHTQFTEMKRLCLNKERSNDEHYEYRDLTDELVKRISANDYLPDDLPAEAVAQMFPREERSNNKTSVDNVGRNMIECRKQRRQC